jgi:hypothetical protein
MSRMQKDSRDKTGTVCAIVRTGTDTFDIFVNGELIRHFDSENWLRHDLCVRWGYCGEEVEPILTEIKLNGRKLFVS